MEGPEVPELLEVVVEEARDKRGVEMRSKNIRNAAHALKPKHYLRVVTTIYT